MTKARALSLLATGWLLCSPCPALPAPQFTIPNVYAESLTTVRDVNANGYRDLVLGQPGSDKVEIYDGRGIPGPTLLVAYQGVAGTGFGAAVANYGRWDAAAYPLDAVVVGAPDPTPARPNGGVKIYYSSPANPTLLFRSGPRTPTPPGQCFAARYGQSIAVLGDLTGDGHPEIAVGAPDWDTGSCSPVGIVEILDPWNPTSPLLNTIQAPGFLVPTGSSCFPQLQGIAFGFSLAAVGDLDLDGYPDLVVGAPGASTVLVYSGASLRLGMVPAVSGYATMPGAAHGYSLCSVSDLNADGIPDFVIGSPFHSGALGTVNAYSGLTAISAGGGSFTGMFVTSLAVLGSTFGTAVARVRDSNGDGTQDFIAGAGSACNSTGSDFYFFSGATGGWISNTSSANNGYAFAVCATGNAGPSGKPSVMISDTTPGVGVVYVQNP